MRNGKGVHRHLFAVITMAAVLALSAGSAFAQSTWLESIKVAEVGGPSVTLQFGVHPDGSDGVDNGAAGTGTTLIDVDGDSNPDEVEQPPSAVTGIFYGRFVVNLKALIVDYRSGDDSPQVEHTYPIVVDRETAYQPVTLTWNSTTLATKAATCSLSVAGVKYDMLSRSSFEVGGFYPGASIILTSVENYVPPVAYTELAITAQPTATGTAPMALGTITVKAQTAGGTGANTNPQITASVGTGLGTLSGTTTRAADATGVATFDDLVYTNIGTGAGDPETVVITFTANDLSGSALTVNSSNVSVATPPIGIPVFTVTPGAAVEGTNENQTPTFTWGAALNAVSYQFNLGTAASAPACDDILSNEAVTSTTYTSARLADGTGYCAKVRSVDATGATSAYSTTATFDVIPTFGEWGMIFLIASMVLCGGYFLQRRRAGSNA